jgi:hypothetical protein
MGAKEEECNAYRFAFSSSKEEEEVKRGRKRRSDKGRKRRKRRRGRTGKLEEGLKYRSFPEGHQQ